jgi:hypothetical protein
MLSSDRRGGALRSGNLHGDLREILRFTLPCRWGLEAVCFFPRGRSIAGMPSSDTRASDSPLRGEVVYFFAFDVAYEMDRSSIGTLLGHPLEPLQIGTRKRAPRGQVFYRPLVARLPALERMVAGRSVAFDAWIKVLPIGAVSLMLRTPFAAPSLGDLHRWHDPVFDAGGTLEQWVLETVEKARSELAAHAVRPHPRLPEGEFYTVFCVDADSAEIDSSAASWLEAHRQAVAGLLTKEPNESVLSDQEVAESTDCWLSYYRRDLVVSDWDASIVIDEPANFEETLYVMELANMQLEELEAYDVFVDESLEGAYRDLDRRRSPRRAAILPELKALRIDLARFSDELSNITKFFGEWHLARVYENMARLFHLADWQRAIDEKLRTLDSLYEMLKHDQDQRLMVWLEVSIILLFIIDLIAIFLGLGK